MKNLFDFATKELSQDAFLSWFIANCNDKTIGDYSYSFLNFLTGLKLKFGDIKKMTVLQQEHNMDIVVDFWLDKNKKPESHYVLVIEDKTTSSAHSGQLRKYANIMDSWNTEEPNYKDRRFKIFYKVDSITEQDKREIEFGNDGYDKNDRWIVFDVDKIYDFFSNIEETKSEILNSYIEHLRTLHNDLKIVSESPIKEWNFVNYQTFFRENIKCEYKNSHFESWQYQGRLVSSAFYYHPLNNKYNKHVSDDYPSYAYPLVEFVFRKNSDKILIYTHISYHWRDNNDKEHWSWKHAQYDPKDGSREDAKHFLDLIKNSLSKQEGIKVRKMGSDKDQTISVDEILLDGKTNNQIQTEIADKLVKYFELFSSVE